MKTLRVSTFYMPQYERFFPRVLSDVPSHKLLEDVIHPALANDTQQARTFMMLAGETPPPLGGQYAGAESLEVFDEHTGGDESNTLWCSNGFCLLEGYRGWVEGWPQLGLCLTADQLAAYLRSMSEIIFSDGYRSKDRDAVFPDVAVEILADDNEADAQLTYWSLGGIGRRIERVEHDRGPKRKRNKNLKRVLITQRIEDEIWWVDEATGKPERQVRTAEPDPDPLNEIAKVIELYLPEQLDMGSTVADTLWHFTEVARSYTDLDAAGRQAVMEMFNDHQRTHLTDLVATLGERAMNETDPDFLVGAALAVEVQSAPPLPQEIHPRVFGIVHHCAEQLGIEPSTPSEIAPGDPFPIFNEGYTRFLTVTSEAERGLANFGLQQVQIDRRIRIRPSSYRPPRPTRKQEPDPRDILWDIQAAEEARKNRKKKQKGS